MASYELIPFQKDFHAVTIVAAVETEQASTLNVGFWITDPYQTVQWTSSQDQLARQDFLWQHTCFEIFIGIQEQDPYREIHLVPPHAWQAYQFEEYRYPESTPPQIAADITLQDLQRTAYGLKASLDLSEFMRNHRLQWDDLYLGLCAVIDTQTGQQLYALQHQSLSQADFHNKRDWLHRF
ncbi:DOMON domain-containing protein [Acinetobacter larvae]|uniref:DOMON-like domain-containing protein n=1 Tax=Acinetobacter larvae TaxID=1789224 RepID=A0A1B2LXN3_9GAMM|nr:hypothetical protein [Acinetobacter larvae]AOA57732.1 hypothetical protein BFG52_04735 [Acinetobacter larvae]